MGGYSTVVVGTDGSETSFRAVERAAVLARDAGALLVIACAYVPERPDPRTQDVLGDEAYQVTGSAPADDTVRAARDLAVAAGAPKVDTVAVQGKPADVLRRIAAERDADLLVVGNRGLNTLAGRIIGSVPLDVVRHAPVDVLVVHTT
ncbi:MAG TPA: universal stress protein [Jatrophihabitans sp.]|nr:universal stress protein [Jatrophihabitans sp.]